MKHLLKKPQKRNNNYVSNFEKPLNKITLNDIKILNINKGLECHIPINNNEKSIEFIEEIDKISYETLKENPDYLIDENQYDKLDMIYNYSYLNDINNIKTSKDTYSQDEMLNG